MKVVEKNIFQLVTIHQSQLMNPTLLYAVKEATKLFIKMRQIRYFIFSIKFRRVPKSKQTIFFFNYSRLIAIKEPYSVIYNTKSNGIILKDARNLLNYIFIYIQMS